MAYGVLGVLRLFCACSVLWHSVPTGVLCRLELWLPRRGRLIGGSDCHGRWDNGRSGVLLQ